jgi:hypothetical protein
MAAVDSSVFVNAIRGTDAHPTKANSAAAATTLFIHIVTSSPVTTSSPSPPRASMWRGQFAECAEKLHEVFPRGEMSELQRVPGSSMWRGQYPNI